MNFYNENDPFAAQWLRNLIAAGLIPPGEVDERSIADVRPSDLEGFTQCHFFAGIGGWSLALQLAGWPVTRPVWTGSCPCQPFSAAGKRKGFADDRHLWPVFRALIAERRPPVVFGEQVAAAADWLGLVRSDLEAVDYAVGAIPIEAASAGADHLRDRFWFVGNDTRLGRGEGRTEHELWRGRSASSGDGRSGVAQGDAYDTRLQGRGAQREGAGELPAGSASLAHAHVSGEGEGREQRSGQQRGLGGDQKACAGPMADSTSAGSLPGTHTGIHCRKEVAGPRDGQSERRGGLDLADTCGDGTGHGSRDGAAPEGTAERIHWRASRSSFAPRLDGQDHEWVIGADGKARRVKPGVRLLAHGIPNRVGLLRGFGNAIDPRPAALFIEATMTRQVTATGLRERKRAST